MTPDLDTRQLSKATTNASVLARDDRDYRGRTGVARRAQARAKVEARRAARRADDAACVLAVREGDGGAE